MFEVRGNTVTAQGELDLLVAANLRSALVATVHAAGQGGLTRVDLASVTFIDSTGLGALIDASVEARELGVIFELVNVPHPVARVITIAGVAELLGVEEAGAQPA